MTERRSTCVYCGAHFRRNRIGRPRQYCSQVCRQHAYLGRISQENEASIEAADTARAPSPTQPVLGLLPS